MMMPKPIASAEPNVQRVVIIRKYRWIPVAKLKVIEATEETYRRLAFELYSEKPAYKEDSRHQIAASAPTTNWDRPIITRANIIGSRRAVIAEFGDFRNERAEESGNKIKKRAAESRTHSRSKASCRRVRLLHIAI